MRYEPTVSPDFGTEPDRRFRRLLGDEAWLQLPRSVRRRFGKRLSGGASVVYQGEVASMRINLAGRLISQLARLVGGPLPFDSSSVGLPAVVSVTEDLSSDGQFWTRQYGRASGFPQVVHSSKRFVGPTGIEEYIGAGIGMALVVRASRQSLIFESDHYFLQVGQRRLRFPKWFGPGALRIEHRPLDATRFLFALRLKSRVFGEMLSQDAVFQEQED